jgi:hypothetical protein
MSKHLRTIKHERMMEAKSNRKGTLPEKPKFDGDVVWEGNKVYYVEAEKDDDGKVEEVDKEETRKYLGTRVFWEGNRVYLKEVFEGDKDETVHEIGGRVQPKEKGKVVWKDNVAYYEPAEGCEDSWDDTRCAPCPYAKPVFNGQVVWTRVEGSRWEVKYE